MTEPEHEGIEHDEATETVLSPETFIDDDEAASEAGEAETPPSEPAEASTAQGTTPEEWEKRHAKARKAFKSYTASVGRIYEEDANAYLPCPLCSDDPSGFLNPADFGKYPNDIVQVVLGVLGQTASSEVPDDPYSDLCETCQGWGVVRTGSKVPNQETRTCLDCTGRGYQPKGTAPVAQGGNGQVHTELDGGAFVPAQTGPESPEIEALRLRGYTIVPPMQAAS